ncbi:SAM-dependent methyltransferase [Anditalea andensis]|uniref:Methyltransferase n=1 Tax=Anditalea andensis TaxID=1048983 RepID=A0A074L095_9BACT|nr:class I SAM-dependent methyltransferase [Anditalea andensis]KEO73298.1 methyltransferase [Anditalea andensis]
MEELKEVKEGWFSTWFDSPYYHQLYKNRDAQEARDFIDNLDRYFQWKPEDAILDLGCGKGRHSIYLNQKGAKVTGIDLSIQNITFANRFNNDRLTFSVHDMREVFNKNAFTHVVNLFTSFGYFTSEEENLSVFNSVYENLVPGGYFLIDYLNPHKVIRELIVKEVKEIEGINFNIGRRIEEGYIIKDIVFKAGGLAHYFQERVQILQEEEFRTYLHLTGFRVEAVFGDYKLNPFDVDNSDRMIFIAKKTMHVD